MRSGYSSEVLQMALHTYYSEKRLLRVSWGEVLDLKAVRTHFELLKANTHYDRNLRVLTSSPVEEIKVPLTRENMLLIKSWREDALSEYESITSAIYSLKPIPAAYISYFSEFFDSEKSLIKQFSSESAALAWLMERH